MEISVPIGLAREAHIAISRRDRPSSLRVPSCPLTGLFQGPQTVTLVDLEKVDGNTTLLEQLVILGLAKQRGVRAVFEFGTFDGKTAANLAATLGPDAEILTIDLPAHQEAALPVEEAEVVYIHKEQSGAKSRHFSNVFQLYGDTARFDFTHWFGTRDLVFVDASHAYDYVLSDSELALQLLRPDGLLLWHDYGVWPGVTEALNDLHRADPRFAGMKHVEGTSLCFLPLPGS
jgi:predicted O-methyltransferase YrrM